MSKRPSPPAKTIETALLTASTGAWYRLLTAQNEELKARLRGRMRQGAAASTNPVAVGDKVYFERNSDGTASITGFEPRTNEMIRQSTHRKNDHQLLAANLDQAAVVQSFRAPHYKFGFIDRFLVTCEAYQIPALIIINKNDLDPVAKTERQQFIETYTAAGYSVVFTSVSNRQSIERLEAVLAGKKTLFIGQSGVGKSSLLNALNPAFERKTATVSDFNEKGRHTTTYAEMLPVKDGGFVIDTPGLREWGLAGFKPYEIGYFFPEIEPLKQECPHRQCICSAEPDCPVMKAFEEKKLAPSRVDSFLQMMESLES